MTPLQVQSQQLSIYPILKPFQELAEKTIQRHVFKLDLNNKLNNAYVYALTNGGKRFRPAVVFMLADALNSKNDVSQAALAIELCHTASLIADDLPIMDDDDERRDKPSLHKAFDESTALLTSYAMIADAYSCIAANARIINHPQSSHIGLLAIENASLNTGIHGAAMGQFLDLNPPDLSEKTLLEVIQKKTVALFEVAFVLGWLFGNGEASKLDKVKQAAAHFGIAFQIADDLDDMKQDADHGHVVNYAAICGDQKARDVFHGEINAYRSILQELGIASQPLLHLASLLELIAH